MKLIKISQSLIVASGEKKNFLEFEGGLQVEISEAEYVRLQDQHNKIAKQKLMSIMLNEDEGVQQL